MSNRRVPVQAARVAVIGAGYVGLTTAACLAHLGHQVHCVDVDSERVAALKRAEVPIRELDLDALVAEGLATGRLQFGCDAAAAAADAGFVFICVPTPEGEDGAADTSFVAAAVDVIRTSIQPGTVVVLKSTAPIGTTRWIAERLRRQDVGVVSNPEFLCEGTAVGDFLHPSRVVVGSVDERWSSAVARLYAPIGAPILVTDAESAETIKYVANTFLAMKVSFVNEVADLCDAFGADVRSVVEGLGRDDRIGARFLEPGPGWGGPCFPKDTRALARMARDSGCGAGLFEQVIDSNSTHQDRVVEKARRLCGGTLERRRVAVWGLTFKSGTDDIRQSPSITVAARMREAGAQLRAYDPTVGHPVDGLDVCSDPYSACRGADLLTVMTGWSEFREMDFVKAAALMRTPSVLDTRNLLDADVVRRAGLQYEGLGVR